MILCDQSHIDSYAAQGLWGDDTLDGLLGKHAAAAPSKTALTDAPDKARFSDCPWYRFDFARADRMVNALAAHFAALGLKEDDVVAVQLGNIVENHLTLLALMRAKLIACPLPPLWREFEIKAALAQVPVRAIVTETRIGGHRHADMMRFVAADIFSVRHVLAFGEAVPDGVLALSDLLDGDGIGAPHVAPRSDAANHVAAVTWQIGPTAAPRPVARSHNEWLAAARMHVASTGLNDSDVMFCPYFPANLRGLAIGLASCLVSGAGMALYQAGAEDAIADRLADAGATYAALPPSILAGLLGEDAGQAANRLRAAGCVWPSPEMAAEGGELAAAGVRIFDIHGFGESALYVAPREGARPAASIPLGQINIPHGAGDGSTLLEARLAGGPRKAGLGGSALSGLLHVRGPMVPSRRAVGEAPRAGGDFAPGLAAQGFMATGITCDVVAGTPPAARFLTREDGVVTVGALPVSLDELDMVLAEHSGLREAVSFTLPDADMGHRLFAAAVPAPACSVSQADVLNYLTARKVAPYKFPEQVLALDAMPRAQDGSVDRKVLAGRLRA